MGFHSFLQGQNVPFESVIAKVWNKKMFKHIREQADGGKPTVVADPDGEVTRQYKAIARQVAVKIAAQSKDFSSKFPTITISKNS